MKNKIICDTNIWFKIGNEEINHYKIEDLNLFVTNLTIEEIIYNAYISDKLNYSNACKAILKYAKGWFYEEPIPHIISHFSDKQLLLNKDYQLRAVEMIANSKNNTDISISKELILEQRAKYKSFFERLLPSFKMIHEIKVALSNTDQDVISVEEYFKSKIGKQDFYNYFKHKLLYEIDNKISKDIFEEKANEIHLFFEIISHYTIDKILEAKNPYFEINDFNKILQFCYVNNNCYFWTDDENLDSLIRKTGYQHFIFQPS